MDTVIMLGLVTDECGRGAASQATACCLWQPDQCKYCRSI